MLNNDRNTIETGRKRQLTAEELKYIKQYNWLRLVKLINFKFPIVLGAIGMSVLIYLLFFFLSDKTVNAKTSPLVDDVVRYGMPSLIILIAIIFIWYKSAKIKWWLSTKNLEAVELTGPLNLQTILGNTTRWYIDQTGIIFPAHWEQCSDGPLLGSSQQTTWAVKRIDATGKVSKYRFQGLEARNQTDPYVIFQDFQYMILSFGKLSLIDEAKHKLPSIRASGTWLITGIVGMIFAIFTSIALSIKYENHNREALTSTYKRDNAVKKLNLNPDIKLSSFQYRDLPLLASYETNTQHVIFSDEKIKYVVRSFNTTDQPFILTEPELKMIDQISNVIPNVASKTGNESSIMSNEQRIELQKISNQAHSLPESLLFPEMIKHVEQLLSETQLNSEELSNTDILKYRQALNDSINQTADVPEKLIQNTLEILSTINDELLKLQIVNYSNSGITNSDFLKKFMPPVIYQPIEEDGYFKTHNGITCYNESLCEHSNFSNTLIMEGFALVNGENATDGAIKIITKDDFDALVEVANKPIEKNFITPIYYWTQGHGAISTVMYAIMTILILSYAQASWRIKNFYNNGK